MTAIVGAPWEPSARGAASQIPVSVPGVTVDHVIEGSGFEIVTERSRSTATSVVLCHGNQPPRPLEVLEGTRPRMHDRPRPRPVLEAARVVAQARQPSQLERELVLAPRRRESGVP